MHGYGYMGSTLYRSFAWRVEFLSCWAGKSVGAWSEATYGGILHTDDHAYMDEFECADSSAQALLYIRYAPELKRLTNLTSVYFAKSSIIKNWSPLRCLRTHVGIGTLESALVVLQNSISIRSIPNFSLYSIFYLTNNHLYQRAPNEHHDTSVNIFSARKHSQPRPNEVSHIEFRNRGADVLARLGLGLGVAVDVGLASPPPDSSPLDIELS
jgi:hypothetical protein